MTTPRMIGTCVLVCTCLSLVHQCGAEETGQTIPRSDGKVLHVDFENYVDGVVQALNAGVRWLGDPFSDRREGRAAITTTGAFRGRRAAHVASASRDEIARVRLQRRYDAPKVNGEMVVEFMFLSSDDGGIDPDDLTIWSARSSEGRPVGLTLHANGTTAGGTYRIDVTHAQAAGSPDRHRTTGVIEDVAPAVWLRLIQYRRRQGTVELWVGPPGSEKQVGEFFDLDPQGDLATAEFGDTSQASIRGSGYWDDVRVGGLLTDSGHVASPEPPLRNVGRERAAVSLPIHVGRERRLFLDDAVIESQDGLCRTVHSVRKHPQNPLIVADKPWEGRSVLLYGGVIRDPVDRRFRMWYLAWGKHIGQPSFVCHAESSDGIHWRKTEVGLHKFQDSTKNNIVLPGWSQTSVLYDPADSDPARRYKALLRYNGMRGFTSPDGLHWKDVGVLLEQAYDGTTLHWDPVNQKWLAMVKIFKDGRRARGYAESEDFLHWSDTYFMSTIDHQDAADDEMYGMAMFHYENIYVGLLRMYHTQKDTIDIQLATSRNGKHWVRPARTPFIPTGANREDWDFGNNSVPATPPIRVGDELWFYYSGRSTLHNEVPNDGAIGLATLRADGFASMDAATRGTLTTKPLRLDRGDLFVNADAQEGAIEVEVLDVDGKTIPGFGREFAQAITDNGTRQRAGWTHDQPLPAEVVRLRFHLSRAKLYAFWIEQP